MAGGRGRGGAGLIPHQLCLAVGLVITHVISHYCFLVQRQRAAEGRQGKPFDGVDVGGLGVGGICGIFDTSSPL